MATTFQTTPSWTDNTSVLAATTIANGATAKGTIDLRAKLGARLFLWLGRKGATAPGVAISVLVRAVNNNGTATPGGTTQPYAALASNLTAGNATTVNADAAAGASAITVASGTGFVAGDQVCIYDASFTRLEFLRVSKVSGTTVTFDDVLLYAHTAVQADNVTRCADWWNVGVFPGGSLYEVVYDFGGTGSGSDIVALVKAQTYDNDQSVQTA